MLICFLITVMQGCLFPIGGGTVYQYGGVSHGLLNNAEADHGEVVG